MGTNLCSCDVLKENKNTIFLTYFADNQNNDNLGISFETNNKCQENEKKQNKNLLNINQTNLNGKSSFNSIETIDKNENRNNFDINIDDDEIIINYSNNSNFDYSHTNRNSSFSIMKVNPVLSIENIKDNQESSSINTKLIFDKLVNGNNNN
jgi:hypothetical protein